MIVEQQFFQAGARHADQFQLEFFGCAGGHAAFGNVLLAAARGLYHLIMGAGATANPAVAKNNRSIIHNFRHLIRLEVAKPAVSIDEAVRLIHTKISCAVSLVMVFVPRITGSGELGFGPNDLEKYCNPPLLTAHLILSAMISPKPSTVCNSKLLAEIAASTLPNLARSRSALSGPTPGNPCKMKSCLFRLLFGR